MTNKMISKNFGEVVAEIKMFRAQNKSLSFLIVEGSDDCKFWTPRVHTMCRVVCATCKTVGKNAVYRLNNNFNGHVGVFDCDYDDFHRGSNVPANILYWDAHSIECILFDAAFNSVAHELIGDEELEKINRNLSESLDARLRYIALRIGQFRALHAFSGADGEKGAFSPYKFITNDAGITFNEVALLEEAVRMKAVPSAAQAKNKISDLPDVHEKYYMRGHDLTAIFSVAIKSYGKSFSASDIEQMLRLAFRPTDLVNSKLYEDIRSWERIRTSYVVLN